MSIAVAARRLARLVFKRARRLRAWRSKRPIIIVMYHAVDRSPGPYTVRPEAFTQQLEFITHHYLILRLKDIGRALDHSRDSIRHVVITFDDAYASFLDFAYPVLERLSVPCTVFVPSGYIGRVNEWELGDSAYGDSAYYERQIMTSAQLRSLQASGLVDIGSHTVNHLRMSALPAAEMRRQAIASRQALERLLETKVRLFAYPYGQLDDFSSATTRVLAEAGYEIAVTTHWGANDSKADLLKLRRIWFSNGDRGDNVREKIEGYDDWIVVKERLGYTYRRIKQVLGHFGHSRKEY